MSCRRRHEEGFRGFRHKEPMTLWVLTLQGRKVRRFFDKEEIDGSIPSGVTTKTSHIGEVFTFHKHEERKEQIMVANKSLFQSVSPARVAPPTNAVNAPGGRAYSLSDEAALAQFACTGTFNNTFYNDAASQLATVKELAFKVSPLMLAKTAVYSRETAYMKDMGAFLLAVLLVRDAELFKAVFHRVCDNGKMLRNFVQIVRSGQVGRKSFGSMPKRLIKQWIESRTNDQLLNDSVGNDPSLADVIKMVHPQPNNDTRAALFAWLLGKEPKAGVEALPQSVKDFEAFKAGTPDKRVVPERLNFQMLTAQNLSDGEWKALAKGMKWQATRMNLNTMLRHGVFKDQGMVDLVANKLSDAGNVKHAKVFPYQLFAAYKNAEAEVPTKVTNALQAAMEHAVANIPSLNGKRVLVAVDHSGSMSAPVTGTQQRGVSSKIQCNDVAALFAACLVRKNPNGYDVLKFATEATRVRVNPLDSVMTIAQTIGGGGGGTDCSAPIRKWNSDNTKGDVVVILSDNESWVDRPVYGHTNVGTGVMQEWLKFKARNPGAKLVCVDLAAAPTTQAPNSPDRLNVGGFSDAVFDTIASFVENSNGSNEYWVNKIMSAVDLTAPAKTLNE